MLRRIIFVTTIAFVPGIVIRAEAQGPEPPRITMPRVSRPPKISDFERMEVVDAPLGMRRIDGFVQRFPNDGEPVSERTIVYAGYDTGSLYVAFLCFDRQAGRVGAHLLPRDAFPDDEDTVAVHIDTFRDLKHAYGFQVNPYGVQTEGTYTEGQGWDLSWDTVWRSDAVRTPHGYAVLITIPFRSLRFPAAEKQQWGMFFFREIARRNEQVFWPECSTRVAARLRQAAVVDGIEHVSPGRNLQAIPYVASRSFRTLDVRPDSASFVSKPIDSSIGLDAKAVIRDSIVVDGTVSPDFSQVESDQPQITVNRPFEVFFPEKRPFFLENAAYFNTPIQLLFTRRIADPRVGSRATGRAGPYSIGAMVVDDRAGANAAASGPAWLGVARVVRDVGRESSAGVFVSDRKDGATTNSVAALDGRLKLGSNWFAVGQGVVTDSREQGLAAPTGSAATASLVGSGRRFNYEVDYNDRSPGFRVVDGFVPRTDIRSIDQTYSFRARPRSRRLHAWGPDLVANRTWDHSGRPLDWAVTPRFELQWQGATTLNVYYTAGRQTLRPAEIGTIVSAADVDVSRSGFTFTSAILPRVIGSATFFTGAAPNIAPVPGIAPAAGHITDATVSATVRLSNATMLDVSYLLDQLSDSAAGRNVYTNTIARVRIGEQFTTAAALRVIVQYNELAVDAAQTVLQPARNLNYDVLFTYLAAPGSAIYIGANYNLADLDPQLRAAPYGILRSQALHNTGWQVFTKLSYLIRR